MELNYTFTKPIEEVYPYFFDLQKFASVHPVVQKIEEISENKYLFHEKMGPFTFRYLVYRLPSEMPLQIVLSSTILRYLQLKLDIRLQPLDTGTQLQEKVSVQAPLPIKVLFLKLFPPIHYQLFKRIQDQEGNLVF